jgi:SAM-dependent methyltransferase
LVEAGGWTPKKSLDLESRREKARKMIELLRSWKDLRGKSILEIGTGAGVAAAALARAVGLEGQVTAVDVSDLRLVTEGFDFRLVQGTSLPFEEESFDVVVSNMVIEHLGNREDQLNHLREIRRVLTDDGCAYMAMPNRWAPREPHFGVPLLTWLPQRWRTPYLRLVRRAVFDIMPLSYGEASKMFHRARLAFTEQTYQAMRIMARVEKPWIGVRLLLMAPPPFLKLLHPVVPTFIFRLEPSKSA